MRARNIIIILIIIGLGVGAYFMFFNNKPSTDSTQSGADVIAADGSSGATANSTDAANAGVTTTQPAKVTVSSATQNSTYYIEALGTVKAKQQIKVYPQTTGQIALVQVNEGDYVHKGDVLFVIGGTNGRDHASVIQTKLAETNLAAAQKILAETIDGNNASLQAAQLQLQSAQHQLDGTYTDLSVMDRSMQGIDQGTNLSANSLNRTIYSNRESLEKIAVGMDQLRSGIDTLQQSRNDLANTESQQLSQITDPATYAKTKADFDAQLSTIDGKITDLNNQLVQAQIGYEGARASLPLTENQIVGTLIQSNTQRDVLAMQQMSAQQKLGMSNGTSDPVKLAQVGVQAATIKNGLSLAQAQTAVEVAQLNVQLAKTQKEALWVKAPTDGIATDVAVNVGDLVSPQVALTSVINPGQFELKVGVDSDSAQKITRDAVGQIQLGGRYVNVPISMVSPVVDPVTHLVTVTLRLPNIFFRPNDTLTAKIPLSSNLAMQQDQSGGQQAAISVPLDAVIIGTEEQYVYVLENGRAVKRTVKLGAINGSEVQVLQGIGPNDQVIVDGAKNLSDGQSVSV